MSEVSYQLSVKSPDDRTPCLSVVCSSSWEVKQLKDHLFEIHPSHPPPSSQRLIHAGKLLKDDIPIKALFKDPKEMQTVHLVCRNSPQSTQNTRQTKKTTVTDTPVDMPPAELERYQREYYEYLQNFFMANGNDNTVAATNNSGTTGVTAPPAPQALWYTHPAWGGMGSVNQAWPYWYHPAAYGYPSLGHMPPSGSGSADINTGAANAVATGAGWMQGAHSVLAGLAVGDTHAPGPVEGAQPEVQPQQVQQPQPEVQPQQAQPQQAMMVGNPMMGGFMGAEEFGEGGGEHMDIVDRFYMLFRLCLFIGLCFAYSSLDKAIIVFSVAAYVYFYNIYRRHAAIRRAAAEAQQNREPTTPPVREPDQTNTPNTRTEESTNGNTDPDQQLRQRVDSSNQSEVSTTIETPPAEPARIQQLTGALRLVVSTSYQFFSSLLTSLIPEQPPPIRLE